MHRKLLVQIIALIVLAVFAIGIWLSGDELQTKWMRFFSMAVWIAVLALLLWDKLLWRLGVVQKIPDVPRNVRGTWKGILRSFWTDPSTGERHPEIDAYLVVRQDASRLTVVLLTNESRSVSTTANISDDSSGSVLSYVYLNQPEIRVEDRSRMHNGAVLLRAIGLPVTRLSGRYWTDRDTRGEMEFTQRHSSMAEGFEEAVRLFES